MSARVFIYVQHLLGIGHLVRSNRIAEALRDAGFAVTMAIGGAPVKGFPGPGLNIVSLPPVKAGAEGFSSLVDGAGNPIDDTFKAARRDLLVNAFRAAKPDILIVESFPFGRRAMRFDLLPLLEAARAMPNRPLIATSVRDILQATSKPGRAEETVQTIETYFDLVLVHGDPSFAALGETFPLASTITKEIFHTGLVAGPLPPVPQDHYDIVVSAGGGAAGFALMRAAAQMIRQFNGSHRCCLITGPNLGQAETFKGMDVFTFRPDFPSLLRGARLSISQAGYNTICDILRVGCRSLLIPFAAGGETEQTERAMKLKKLGLADVLLEADINAATLAAVVERLLAAPPPPINTLNLDGAERTARFLKDRFKA